MLRNINLHKKSQTITNTRVSPGERTLRYSVSGNPSYCRHNAIWHTASRKSEGKESCMECMILTGHSGNRGRQTYLSLGQSVYKLVPG